MTRLNREQAKALGVGHLWPKAPRPPSDGMNKLEREFLERLRAARDAHTFQHIWREPVKLRLAGRCWYTPDFATVTSLYELIFWETKGGFFREDAAVKLKVAAETYPCFKFVLVVREKRTWECRSVTSRGISTTPFTPEWLA
jgi:hypothetical protein